MVTNTYWSSTQEYWVEEFNGGIDRRLMTLDPMGREKMVSFIQNDAHLGALAKLLGLSEGRPGPARGKNFE